MCLSLEIARPQDVLESGVLHGHEYRIMSNGMGHRCGYVKVEAGHPWHGGPMAGIDVDVHGGLTFAAKDVPCEAEGPDTGYWLGFDCAHGYDLPDIDLIPEPDLKEFYREHNARELAMNVGAWSLPISVKDTAFVRAECERLALQAKEAVQVAA